MTPPSSVLVVRLGAMGDVLHALPAVASIKLSFPEARICWVVRPRWQDLLAANPYVDEILPFRRGEGFGAVWRSLSKVRHVRPDLAFDFQGLIQSAIVGRMARARDYWGFDHSIAREPLASLFYTHRAKPAGPHRIERNLQLVEAAGVRTLTTESWIPPGQPEGELPRGPFVLAAPLAGWKSKQWPLERYADVSALLERENLTLVLNVAPHQAPGLERFALHVSTLAGLIDATRRATAVIGIDSGPLHLAAALRKPGVAIFGPTDPAANGPFGGSMRVIRKSGYATTYKRENESHPSMQAITAREVFEQLLPQIRTQTALTGSIE